MIKHFTWFFLPSFSQETSPDINLFINSLPIKKENSFKFLCVTIDERLEWKPHIQHIYLRLRRYIGIFYKLSSKLPSKVLKMLYFAMVYPHILYGTEIYTNNDASYLHDLMILNNRLLRIIQHSNLHLNFILNIIQYQLINYSICKYLYMRIMFFSKHPLYHLFS